MTLAGLSFRLTASTPVERVAKIKKNKRWIVEYALLRAFQELPAQSLLRSSIVAHRTGMIKASLLLYSKSHKTVVWSASHLDTIDSPV